MCAKFTSMGHLTLFNLHGLHAQQATCIRCCLASKWWAMVGGW